MSIYTSGLGNVGSYQASGRPFLKTVTSLASTSTEYIKFDNVTKKIRIKNHSTSGKLKIGFADNARRAFDMPNSAGRFVGSFGATLTAFTISFWMKPTSATVSRIIEFTGGHSNSRLQGQSTGKLRLRINGQHVGAATSAADITSIDGWDQVTVVINGTSNKVYLNGVNVATNSEAADGFTGFAIGDMSATNYRDTYDEMYLFNTAFTDAEALELYSSTTYLDPRDHSQAANLTGWWAFEDNANRAYFSTNDTASIIRDRIGSNNLTANGTFDGTEKFVNGRQLDTAVNSHSIIIPALGEVELSVKTKSLFLFADGATQSFDVYASLTNIPSGRMYDLTGAGIDA